MAGGAESVQLAERCWVNRWGWQLCCVSAINTRQLGRPAGVSWHGGCGDQGADTGHFREQQRVARARLRSESPGGGWRAEAEALRRGGRCCSTAVALRQAPQPLCSPPPTPTLKTG